MLRETAKIPDVTPQTNFNMLNKWEKEWTSVACWQHGLGMQIYI